MSLQPQEFDMELDPGVIASVHLMFLVVDREQTFTVSI